MKQPPDWRAAAFGRRVRERREQLGLTQAELADGFSNWGIPITRLEISRREAGRSKLTVDALLAYSWVLDCPVVDLLRDDDGYCQVTPFPPEDAPRRPSKWIRPRTTALYGPAREDLWLWLAFGRGSSRLVIRHPARRRRRGAKAPGPPRRRRQAPQGKASRRPGDEEGGRPAGA